MAHAQPMPPDEDVDIREVQTARLRNMNGMAIIAATEAIRRSGIENGSFRFDPYAADELGMVPAIGSKADADGRSDPLTRPVYRVNDGRTLRVGIPKPALEALEIDPDEIDWDNPPELSVWAGDRLLAFGLPDEQTVTIDRAEEAENGEDDG